MSESRVSRRWRRTGSSLRPRGRGHAGLVEAGDNGPAKTEGGAVRTGGSARRGVDTRVMLRYSSIGRAACRGGSLAEDHGFGPIKVAYEDEKEV